MATAKDVLAAPEQQVLFGAEAEALHDCQRRLILWEGESDDLG